MNAAMTLSDMERESLRGHSVHPSAVLELVHSLRAAKYALHRQETLISRIRGELSRTVDLSLNFEGEISVVLSGALVTAIGMEVIT